MQSAAQLKSKLVEALGASNVSDAQEQCAIFAQDVYNQGALPLLIVRPTSTGALQNAVRICGDAGIAMVPRGGGASYTDGYLMPTGGHILFDLTALDSVEIDLENAIVTVGPGTTWAALKEKLDAHGLRTPFWGPFSGLVASVGGSVSQNSLSHGGSRGISATSIVSMDILLANGEILSTSAAPHCRHFGPDVTGLFTGDCGALGMKTAIRLPLIPQRKYFEALSFAFEDFSKLQQGMRAAALEGLDDEHFGIDAALSQGQIAKNEGIGSKLKIALEVFKSANNPLSGIGQLLRMALAGEAPMKSAPYMSHLIVEGVDAQELAAKVKQLRAVITVFGVEIANTVPAFVRALPFAPLHNILGPSGERWVALHGILSHEKGPQFDAALSAFYAKRAADMERLGVWTGKMFSIPATTSFLYEIALYWPDTQEAYHRAVLDADFLGSIPKHPANPEARAYVDTLKRDLMALFDEYGAAHFQIGRAYDYINRLDAPARALITAMKRELDPKNLMNPGVLGL